MQPETTGPRHRRFGNGPDADLVEAIPDGSIVVGIDGSKGSVAALVWALDEARRRRADIDAVLVWEDVFFVGHPTAISELSRSQRKRLQARLESALIQGEDPAGGVAADVVVRPHIFSASPVSLLGWLSSRAAMLVVGSSGHRSRRASLLGSVSERLSRMSSGTIVIVRGHRSVPVPTGARRRLLVGVDGSPEADAALGWARDTALQSGDHLEVVYAWGGPLGLALEETTASQLSVVGQSVLDRAAEELTPTGIDFAITLDPRTPGAALVDLSGDSDLLIVGARGMGGLASLLLGSVSQRCVTHAGCPVAVVRPRS